MSLPAPGTVLCKGSYLREGAGRGFEFGTGAEQVRLFVVRKGGRVFGYLNVCPHVGMRLDGALDRFFTGDRSLLICAFHGARFRPEDGVCVAGPCIGERLTPVAVEERDGEVILSSRVDEEDRSAAV